MSMTEIITDEKMMGDGKVRVVDFMENVARDACRDVFIALCTSLKFVFNVPNSPEEEILVVFKKVRRLRG